MLCVAIFRSLSCARLRLRAAGFAFMLVALALALPSAAQAPESCASPTLQASFQASGAYSVHLLATNLLLRGQTPQPGRLVRREAADALGTYCALELHQSGETDSIRVYSKAPVITFTVRAERTMSAPLDFPVLSGFSPSLYRMGHRVQPFAGYQFGVLGEQGPWVLFDQPLHTLVLSPADHFFVTRMQMEQQTLRSGLVASIGTLPTGFRHTTVLVADTGIHAALRDWGGAMQAWAARPKVANDADPLLRSLSYWTDNGATYYYKFDPQLGYTGTLLAIAAKYRADGIPPGLMQLDSWFYPKGPQKDWRIFNWKNGAGGAYLYEPDKRLFPDGMGAFARQLQLPLAVHGRWIDASSPYRSEYKISGNVVIDPRYWEATAKWMAAAHVVVYEQDWLGSFAQAAQNLTDPEQFHDQMARAMRAHGITMQYCMGAPADYMQGTRYSNLTTIRTSDDRFERKKWDSFLYDSQMAYALGIWPWTDVFMSAELPNLVLSTLSSGPVGVGDGLGTINAPNLKRAARADGVLVKPDAGIRPLDRVYLSDARRLSDARQEAAPMIAVARSRQPAARVSYVFAYPRGTETAATFTPAELGSTGISYVYDWRNGTGETVTSGSTAAIPLRDGWGYAVVTPVLRNGLALIGDPQMIVTAGRQRLTARLEPNGALRIRLLFAPGETQQELLVYAAAPPKVTSISGRLAASHYDDAEHLLHLTLTAGADGVGAVRLLP